MIWGGKLSLGILVILVSTIVFFALILGFSAITGNVLADSDTTPPYFINFPYNMEVFSNENIIQEINASDETALDCFSINDSDNFEINCSGYFQNKTAVAIGLYNINVTINDTSNNIDSAVFYVNVSAACIENLLNTSFSSWLDLICDGSQMNQSRFLVQYDENDCGYLNETIYEYQLVNDWQNTSWTAWYNLSSCYANNTILQERNLTNYDSYGCASNFSSFDYQEASCDFCTPAMQNTSWGAWKDLSCITNQMNQSRNKTEYDANVCGEIFNITHFEYQLVSANWMNTSFSNWENISCLANDKMNQSRFLTNYDSYGCASNFSSFEYQQTENCDFCTPNMQNTSFSNWINISSCYTNNTILQSRNKTEYDANTCNEIANTTWFEYQETSCDFCTPNMQNTTKTSWIDLTCSNDKMNQSRNWTEYDSNVCNEIANSTWFEYRLVNPIWQNTSWGAWSNLTACRANDTILQERNLTNYDSYGCGANFTSFMYQEAACDFCTESYANTTKSNWIDLTCSGSQMNQSRNWTQYDTNNCGYTNHTFFEYQLLNPVWQNTSFSNWENISCLANDKMNQSRFLTNYDSYGCASNFSSFEYQQTENCDFCTPNLQNTSWGSWQDYDCNSNQKRQQRNKTQYDSNNCNEIANETFFDYQLIGNNWQNTTKTNWINTICASNQMNQSRNWTQYDLWNCGINSTFLEYQLVNIWQNTSWGSWQNLSCSGNDRNQSRNLTQYDNYGCGSNTSIFQYQLLTANLTYTSWGAWSDLSCESEQMNQSRNRTQYDSNKLGCFANTIQYDSQLVGPNLFNTSWNAWTNYACAGSQMLQNRNLTQYDAYGCKMNETILGYQLLNPVWQNTSWTAWYNISECRTNNTILKAKNLTNYDSYGCGANFTSFMYQETSCDFCTPFYQNTSWTAWGNIACIASQMNQSRNKTQYDDNLCGEYNNETFFEYQLVSANWMNTSFSNWENISCLANDKMNQSRFLTNYDSYGCGSNFSSFEYQQTENCDFCTPNMQNTSFSNWINISSCYTNNTILQSRNKTEYDANTCNEIANTTWFEYQETSCDFCTPNMQNTSWTAWGNIICVASQMNQSRNKTEYDSNVCNEIANSTWFEYRLVNPIWQNTSWGAWSNLSCIGNNMNQSRNRTQYDNYGCGSNTSIFQYQLLTANLTYTSWTSWQDLSCSNNQMNQSRNRTQYDSNNLGCFLAQTESDSRLVNTWINTSWTSWQDENCINTTTMNQSRYKTQYDAYGCGVNTSFYENQEIADASCVDTIPPYVAFISPISKAYDTNPILVNITNSSDAAFVFWDNGTANLSYLEPVELTLENGNYNFIAYANDSYGNLNSSSVSFIVALSSGDDSGDDSGGGGGSGGGYFPITPVNNTNQTVNNSVQQNNPSRQDNPESQQGSNIDNSDSFAPTGLVIGSERSFLNKYFILITLGFIIAVMGAVLILRLHTRNKYNVNNLRFEKGL